MMRYAETTGVPRVAAQEVAKFFLNLVVGRHGAPEVLIADRGTPFTAEHMQEI